MKTIRRGVVFGHVVTLDEPVITSERVEGGVRVALTQPYSIERASVIHRDSSLDSSGPPFGTPQNDTLFEAS